ncbi:MAG: SDR family NAD(P)-dependent oxidoreductase [Nocardiaceae bacterium]|nr:SDR family NAD(P)-dependent oxidoreductase [Nocardiaceae bacterium]
MTSWSERSVAAQRGRTFVVTGATSGLGEATARALGRSGAQVILAVRDLDAGEEVARQIGSNADVRKLDLTSLESISAFASSIDEIDVLINNAGVMAVPFGRTSDGFELQIGTNHLGHFALTGQLLECVRDRVVTVSSSFHSYGSIDLDDLNWRVRPYNRWLAYAQSKLANLMFAYELQRRLTNAGSKVRSVAAHPGYTATGLQHHTESIQDRVMALGNMIVAQNVRAGALPLLFAATEPDIAGGDYIGPQGFFGMRGSPGPAKSTRASRDPLIARELWNLSESLTSVKFSFNGLLA